MYCKIFLLFLFIVEEILIASFEVDFGGGGCLFVWGPLAVFLVWFGFLTEALETELSQKFGG